MRSADARERDPETLVLRKREARRHHADDRGGAAVDAHRSPDDPGIALISALPHVVAQDHDRLGARPVVVRAEVASERRRRAEHLEERGRDRRPQVPFGIAAAVRQRQAAAGERRDVRDRRRRPPDVEVVLVRDARALDAHALVGRVDDGDLLGVGIGVRVQEDAVHHAEDRGVGANPERQADDRHRQEARTPEQRPDGVTRILQKHGSL